MTSEIKEMIFKQIETVSKMKSILDEAGVDNPANLPKNKLQDYKVLSILNMTIRGNLYRNDIVIVNGEFFTKNGDTKTKIDLDSLKNE